MWVALIVYEAQHSNADENSAQNDPKSEFVQEQAPFLPSISSG